MRRVEVLNHRLLPGIADPSLEVNQASASAKGESLPVQAAKRRELSL